MTIVQAIRIQTIADLATYTESQAIIEWSIVEINLGVIIACIPTFRPLLRSVGRKIASSSNGKGSLRQQSNNAHTKVKTASHIHDSGKKGMFASVRETADRVVEEDEIELWDGGRGPLGQQRRASARVRADATIDDELSPASSRLDNRQITVSHEVSIQYGDEASVQKQ